jgi:hypothetical protein
MKVKGLGMIVIDIQINMKYKLIARGNNMCSMICSMMCYIKDNGEYIASHIPKVC